MQSIAVAVDMNTDESTFTIPTMLQVRSGGTTILGGGTGKKCHQVFVVLLLARKFSEKNRGGKCYQPPSSSLFIVFRGRGACP